jgi:hypothetical protein
MIPGSINPLLFASAAGAAANYEIERSLRFNAVDSAYLNRTPASAGNRKTWTWSGWVKRSGLTIGHLFVCDTGTTSDTGYLRLWFNGNQLWIGAYNTTFRATTANFRDPSAWYHVTCAVNTTLSTANDRIKLYVNGSQITAFNTLVNPAQNADTAINAASPHVIGAQLDASVYDDFFSGYLADIHFIDGQALTPSSFGQTDTNGVWQPKAYTGTYGTNGFKLNFADNSNTTAATLGKDLSGNANNWTPNNFSITAGAGNDSLVDVPTAFGTDTGAGGEVRGNYCTLNPLVGGANSGQITFANGNLDATWSAANNYAVALGSMGVDSGKWYWETLITGNSGYWILGIALANVSLTNYIGGDASGYSYYSLNGTKYNDNASSSYGSSYTTNDIIGIAFDADNGKVFFAKNGTWQASGNPVAGTNAAYTGLTGRFFPAYTEGTNNSATTYSCNFGQRPFAYTAPSGFKALCTENLPEGTITTSGTFTGNANADGPLVYLNGVPTTMTINGNAVTFATHADKLANGFKLRTNSVSYNTSGSNTYSVSATGDKFKNARAQINP